MSKANNCILPQISHSSGPVQLSSLCNHACNCSGVNYVPVCAGPLTYFSPCHAGCSEVNKTNKVWNVKSSLWRATFLYMFTVFCRARCFLLILFCAVSFQGSFSYSNCACVATTGKMLGEAKKGICHVDCGLNFLLFLTILALLPFFTFTNEIPATIVTLRFV